ncbi:hypothetical protein ACTG9Q_15760 [Actinokineospora sp. 24-640]
MRKPARIRSTTALAVTALAGSLIMTTPAHATGVVIDIPSAALADDVLNIEITGLAPNSAVT